MQKMMVSGRLGMDAEVRVTQNGKRFLFMRLATTNRRMNTTVWVSVFYDDEWAVNNTSHFIKGAALLVIGDWSQHEWISQTGERKIDNSVWADSITFNGSGNREQNGTGGYSAASSVPQSAMAINLPPQPQQVQQPTVQSQYQQPQPQAQPQPQYQQPYQTSVQQPAYQQPTVTGNYSQPTQQPLQGQQMGGYTAQQVQPTQEVKDDDLPF